MSSSPAAAPGDTSSPRSRSPGDWWPGAGAPRALSSTARGGARRRRPGRRLEFPYTLLPGRGIRRSLEPRAVVANIGAVAGLAWGCGRAVGSFLVRRPRVVVIVGGYASFPAGVAAVLTRVPLVSMTTDSVPGAVNRLLGRFAAANAVAFENAELPRTHVTGTPVRPELHPLDRSTATSAAGRKDLGLPRDRWTVAAFGGSLGARRINEAVAQLAKEWASCGDRTLYHVTGRRDFTEFRTGPGPGRANRQPAKASRRPRDSVIASSRSRSGCPSSTQQQTCASPGPAP